MIRNSILIPEQPVVESSYGYIYITRCLVNNKLYIGQHRSKTFDYKYLGSGTSLKNAINKYGFTSFDVKPIQWCKTKEELNKAEIWWINFLEAVNNRHKFYNISTGGDGEDLGKEVSKRISKSLTGKNKYI